MSNQKRIVDLHPRDIAELEQMAVRRDDAPELSDEAVERIAFDIEAMRGEEIELPTDEFIERMQRKIGALARLHQNEQKAAHYNWRQWVAAQAKVDDLIAKLESLSIEYARLQDARSALLKQLDKANDALLESQRIRAATALICFGAGFLAAWVLAGVTR